LVPLTVVELMFCNADVSRCVSTSGSVAVRLSDSPRLAQMPIYFVQGGTVRTMSFHNVSPVWAHFKTFEWGLDYRSTMERVQLNVIPRSRLTLEEWHVKIRRYLSMWLTFLKLHKQHQFTIEDRTQWPHNLPWFVKTVGDMPVVIWLTKDAA
jgi:hypothetical protein